MTKNKWFSIAKLTVILVLASLTISWIFVDRQMKLYAGGYTEVVDRTQFKVNTAPILITNISVLSPDGENMIGAQSVFLNGGIIVKVATDIPETELPNNVLIIDGTDQFLIPGLMDAHIHLGQRANDLLLYFANGITHVREMGGAEFMLKMREQGNNGHVGPDMTISTEKIQSGPFLAGLFTEWTRSRINISKLDHIDAEIKKLSDQGYDALKMSGDMSAKFFKEIQKSGEKYGLPIVGHLNVATGLKGLWGSGQSELAHVEEVVKGMIDDFGGYNSESADEFLRYVNKNANEVAIMLRDHEVAVTTTIWLMESLPHQKLELEAALKELGPRLRYVDPGNLEGTFLAKGWLPGHNSYQLSKEIESDPTAIERSKVFWNTYVQAIHLMTAAMSRNDVVLMAGTDTGTPIVISGFSLHDELESLVASGLSNAQALRSATATQGAWLNENIGKIVPGYRANLVLLENNPLESIGATRDILAVIKDGGVYGREQLDAMLFVVAEANDNARTISLENFEKI